MFLSPAEIKQQQLREKRGAYEREDVDGLLDNVVGSYQHVWLERDKLKARVEELEREMTNTKELEQLLRDGLASAQRAAEQVKEEAEQQVSGLVDKAREEAEALLSEARAKAEEIVAGSRETRDRLEEETTRLEQANHDVRERYKAFLLEALSVVEATAEHKAVQPDQAAIAEADESAPVPEEEELQAPVGWLATVPLTAVATDEMEESIERADPEPEPEPEPEAATEPEPEAAAPAEDEEDVPATVLLSAVAAPQAEEEAEEPAAAEEPAEEEPIAVEPEPAAVEEPAAAEPEPEVVEEPEPEDEAPTDEDVLAPVAEAESEAEAESKAESEAEPEAEPEAEAEPEPEEENLAPDDAYMTFRGPIPAIRLAEDPPSETEGEGESGEDSYEDWSPKKN